MRRQRTLYMPWETTSPFDVQHYLDHHLTQPLMGIFEPVCKDVKSELLSGGYLSRGAGRGIRGRLGDGG